MSLKQGLEMARCVEINIDNIVTLLKIVKLQIKDCIKELEEESQ